MFDSQSLKETTYNGAPLEKNNGMSKSIIIFVPFAKLKRRYGADKVWVLKRHHSRTMYNELQIIKERKKVNLTHKKWQCHDDGREKPEASDLWRAVYD